ncbi:MAG TPA: carboxynorspermidine decarboxylase [Thermodesulfobacteriota bacterium]|nr:carboxynorspermidine decarboxylase [Thermodesulfobacteriota bacterium]HNU70519.1 carboxynorspermidine decarboxylase [Thermodesulfobacteriota bacterium]
MPCRKSDVPWADREYWATVDVSEVPTPCYVVDRSRLRMNLEKIRSVSDHSGCTILMALKGFAMWSLFPEISRYLSGVAASSRDEARLGYEEFGKEVHVFSPAYKAEEMFELLGYGSHIIFNSFSQWSRFKADVKAWSDARQKNIQAGIRVNPEHRETDVAMYDPCAPSSRLGVTLAQFEASQLDGISGLHFHTLCEKDADSFERTLSVFEEKFGCFLAAMKWVNFGGGHLITNPEYDADLLAKTLIDFQQRHSHVQMYMEPSEAIALNAGVLVASVLDIVRNEIDSVILDTSAAAHMPDVLEMPYRPEILDAQPLQKRTCSSDSYTYRLGGLTCLAGDVIGDYSFPRPLAVGDRIVFLDMAHYTMVKNNTFNGVRLPSIAVRDFDGTIRVLRTFGYEDYKNRLS